MKIKLSFMFLAASLMLGCSSVSSIKDYNSSWIGAPLDRVKSHFKGRNLYSDRIGLGKIENKKLSDNLGELFDTSTTLFRAFEYHNDLGTCYTDFVIDSHTNKVIGYIFRGDMNVCNEY